MAGGKDASLRYHFLQNDKIGMHSIHLKQMN